MKKIINIKFLLIALLPLGLTACLKERIGNIDTGHGNTQNVIEFKNTGDNVSAQNSTYPRFHIDLGVLKAAQSKTFNINLGYSGVNNAPEDITLNLAVDAAALTKYNTENGSNYIIPPTASFAFPSSVIIKKGTRVTTQEVKVTLTPDFDLSKNYAIPLKIASTSPAGYTLSGNFGSALYSLSVRNIYDGVYTITALAPLVDAAAPSIGGWYPLEGMELRTQTGTSVALWDAVYSGTYGHPIKSGTSGSYYGSFGPLFIFTNDKVTDVSNYWGQLAGGLARSGKIEATYANNVVFNADGTVKYFDVKYYMTQGASYAVRTTFTERFTRTGSR
jgi:predicted heme/steroid binding protein